jgi:hypothetical protein
MSGNLADFSGNIPQNYDSGMGPIIFAGYAADVAQRIASDAPSNVLETASGTGVVQMRQRGGVEPTQIQEAVAKAMRHEFGGEPGVMPIQAIVFEARKT